MGVVHRAVVGPPMNVAVRSGRDDDFANGVIEIVGVIAGNAVAFRLVSPDDDGSVILVGTGGHDRLILVKKIKGHSWERPSLVLAVRELKRGT